MLCLSHSEIILEILDPAVLLVSGRLFRFPIFVKKKFYSPISVLIIRLNIQISKKEINTVNIGNMPLNLKMFRSIRKLCNRSLIYVLKNFSLQKKIETCMNFEGF